MKLSGSTSVDSYLKKISASPAALQQLIESVVISETSFFRNKTPFITLKKYLKQFVLNKNLERPIRILCLPCSTGEEPYSIAMALFDIQMAANQFYIYAGDISEQAIQFAKAGVYSSYSFRGDHLEFRESYFSKQDSNYILHKKVRDAVHFEYANILADNFLLGHKPYDIIFCRNLLIYFDGDIKEKAIKALSAHLADEGVLFVGHAEGAKIQQYGYVSLDYPMSFAFARKEYANKINTALNASNGHSSPAAPASYQPIAPKLPVDNRKTTPVITTPGTYSATETDTNNNSGDDVISQARKLAAKGAFNEVLAICEKLLSEGAESAEVYYLLGQAGEATGSNLMAEENLKKAIYLNTDFYDALIYLSRLYDRMGKPEKAVTFRNRAERVKLRNA